MVSDCMNWSLLSVYSEWMWWRLNWLSTSYCRTDIGVISCRTRCCVRRRPLIKITVFLQNVKYPVPLFFLYVLLTHHSFLYMGVCSYDMFCLLDCEPSHSVRLFFHPILSQCHSSCSWLVPRWSLGGTSLCILLGFPTSLRGIVTQDLHPFHPMFRQVCFLQCSVLSDQLSHVWFSLWVGFSLSHDYIIRWSSISSSITLTDKCHADQSVWSID